MSVSRSLAAGLAVLLAACASESRIEREKPAPLADFEPSHRVVELWSASIGDGAGATHLALPLHLDDDSLYAADREGRVYALASADGAERWRVALDVPLTAAPGVGESLVVVGTRKGEVIALDKRDGKLAWRANLTSEILAPAAIRAAFVVVQTIDGRVYALSAADGKRLWVYERSEPALSLYGTSAPRIVGPYVLTGFAGGKIVGLNLNDGRPIWEHTVAEPRGRNEIERLVDVDAPVLISQDTLYAASYQGKVVAIDTRTGRLNWSRDVSTYTPVALGAAHLYVSDESGTVVALDQRSGSSVWKQDKLKARRLTGPTPMAGTVAVGDYEGYIHWLSIEDGRFVARHRLGSAPMRATGIAVNDVLFAVNQSGQLAALRLLP